MQYSHCTALGGGAIFIASTNNEVTEMTKQEFKKAYGEYRKYARSQFYKGVQGYADAVDSNPFFRKMFIRLDMPVSIKCWVAFKELNDKAA